MGSGLAVVVVLGVLVLGSGLALTLRVVGPAEVLVVRRRGRPVRTHRAGVHLLLPGLEDAIRVPHEIEASPLVVAARTRDGLLLRIFAAASLRADDPVRAAGPDLRTRAADVLESALRTVAAGSTLADIAEHRDALAGRAAARAEEGLADLGLVLTQLRIDEADLDLTPDLLDWADRQRPQG